LPSFRVTYCDDGDWVLIVGFSCFSRSRVEVSDHMVVGPLLILFKLCFVG
jgi:hypothetical protein